MALVNCTTAAATEFFFHGQGTSVGIRHSQLHLHLPAPPTISIARHTQTRAAKGKGFGELLQQRRSTDKNKGETLVQEARPETCPCGGGQELLSYDSCCGVYHSGALEPDAESLMKARFTAYARGVVPYIVQTTHKENPDFEDGDEKKLAEDVRATCKTLRFLRLEILDTETSSSEEAYISFRVSYSIAKGSRGERKYLIEKSKFVKENNKWLYRKRIQLDQASEAAWVISATPNFMEPGRARKSFSTSKAPSNIKPRTV